LAKGLGIKIGDKVAAEKVLNEAASLEGACDLGQALADRYMTPVFVHSFSNWKDGKESEKKYAALLKKHYDNDENRHYGYHLEKIIHPTPIKAIASALKETGELDATEIEELDTIIGE